MGGEALSSIAEVVMGQSPPGESCNKDGEGIPLLNGPTEFGSHHPTPVQFTTDPRKHSKSGDVLFCVRGSTTGRMNWADQEYAIGRGIAAIRHKKGVKYQPFIRALVEYHLPQLLAQATGSTFPNVSYSQLADMACRIPSDAEQCAIAFILGTLDDKIELNRRMNETLEAMAQAIFKSWFVDFGPVRAKAAGEQPRGLAPHIAGLFPDAFEESELEEIPKGWDVWHVADVGEIVCGKTPSTRVPEYYGTDVPFIRIPDMHGKIFATETQKMLSRAGAASQENKTLPPHSICVSCIGTTGLVNITTQESQTNQQINSVIPKSPNETYFWYWSLLGLGDEIKARGSGGSVLTNLSTGRFSQLEILSPPARLRRSYSALVSPHFERILSNDRESGILAALRDTLLPKLISGELRASDAERILDRCL